MAYNFWKNVDYVREYRDMSRKELAYKADFSLTSLSTGIKRNSIPSADVAFRIAKTLNVPIECLLTEKELADIFTNAQEEIDKAAESFNPVPATKEQKERLEKLCEGLVKVELTPIEKMSDNELCRKLDIARRNIEKWQKREKDIQRERSRRYCYRKSLEDTEW